MKIKKRVLSSLLCACLISPAIFSNVNAQEGQCPDFGDLENPIEGIVGDMLVNEDTENAKLYLAKKKEALTFKGTLYVKPIKDRLKCVEDMYVPKYDNLPQKTKQELENNLKTSKEAYEKAKKAYDECKDKNSEEGKRLKSEMDSKKQEYDEYDKTKKRAKKGTQDFTIDNLDFSMTATFTLPEGIKFKDEKPTATLESGGKFEVKSTSLNGKTLTVVMQLTGQGTKGADGKDKYYKYDTMANAVKTAPDTLYLTLSNAEFEDNIKSGKKNGENLTISGTVGGKFSADATDPDTTGGGFPVNFKFDFNSEQSDSGKDFALKNDTNNKNIQLTLTIPYDVKYEFESRTNGKDLPQDVKDKLPKPYEVEKGKTATVDEKGTEKVTFDNVELTDGRWIFNKWDKTKVENVSSDVIFKGFWKFEKVYKVNYEFKSNTSDKELPQEVKKLLPQEEKYYSIQKVKPKDVTPKEVKVGNDTWTFKGFDKNEITLKDGENKFIGSWECKTKQVPTPDPVPTPNPGLDEDEDENNNNDKKQNDKEQKLPQTNIAGNSLLTLALSAIAVVFSKKKRK